MPFAGAHFGDLAVVQRDAADQLDVEVAHVEHAFPGFAHDRERFGKNLFEGLAANAVNSDVVGFVRRFRFVLLHGRWSDLVDAFLDTLAKLIGFRAKLGVGQARGLRLQRIDFAHSAAVLLQQPLVAAAEYLLEHSLDHERGLGPPLPGAKFIKKGWGTAPPCVP